VLTASDSIRIARNAGGGKFMPYIATAGGSLGGWIVGDADGNGVPDIVMPTSEGVVVLRNVCAHPRIRVTALPFVRS
jgi:hypothetical protein